MCRPNFGKISQSTAEILLLPVFEYKCTTDRGIKYRWYAKKLAIYNQYLTTAWKQYKIHM